MKACVPKKQFVGATRLHPDEVRTDSLRRNLATRGNAAQEFRLVGFESLPRAFPSLGNSLGMQGTDALLVQTGRREESSAPAAKPLCSQGTNNLSSEFRCLHLRLAVHVYCV